MAAYRLYCLDGVNHFTRSEAFDAPSDEEALRRARVLMGDAVKGEIWEQTRLVGRLGFRGGDQG